MHLNTDWRFAFEPTLYFHHEIPIPWFFRPLFKILTHGFFTAFQFHYYWWLVTLLVMVVVGLHLSRKTLHLLAPAKDNSALFVILFSAAVYFHYGSLFWVGEGMMNCPQLLLLAATTLFWLQGLLENRWQNQILGLFLFLLSLGLKESSSLHPLLFAMMCFIEPRLRAFSIRRRIYSLLPYFILAAVYLAVRLFLMPLNPHYVPHPNLSFFLKPLVIFGGAFTIPLWIVGVLLALKQPSILRQYVREISLRWPYMLIVALSALPYFGHGFFSPGWLLLPGYYFLFCVGLAPIKLELAFAKKMFYSAGSITFVVALVPLLIYLSDIAWWKWRFGQHQLQTIVQSAPADKIQKLFIYNCPNPLYPKANLERVIAFKASLYQMWKVHHNKSIQVNIRPCGEADAVAKRLETIDDGLFLKWQFPYFTMLQDLTPLQARVQ